MSRLSMHGEKKTYNSDNNKVSFQDIDRLVMSEALLERFKAIDVATKMLGEPQIVCALFTSESAYLDMSIVLNGRKVKHMTSSSSFLWRMKNSVLDLVSLVIPCRENFMLMYPVVKFVASPPGDEMTITIKEIHTEKDLLEVLDDILRSL